MSERLLTDSETVMVGRQHHLGMSAVVVVDDTTLGPGLGGVRWKPYPSEAAAISEAQRLARAMTLKHAAAGLPYGGAKAVIFEGPLDDRRAVMEEFGRLLVGLNGRYIPGVDMGTRVEDLSILSSFVDASCAHEDPSPATARGVFHAIRAAVATTFGSDLSGRTVTIQGVGQVGSMLASLVAQEGAKTVVADLDPSRATAVAESVGGVAVAAEDIVAFSSDVFAPCGSARILTPENVGLLRARIVAGGANDVLSSRDCANLLHDRGVTYIPDFLANAGGVIHIHALRAGWEPQRLEAELAAIGTRVREIMADAVEEGITPLEGAERLASQRIGRRLAIPS